MTENYIDITKFQSIDIWMAKYEILKFCVEITISEL